MTLDDEVRLVARMAVAGRRAEGLNDETARREAVAIAAKALGEHARGGTGALRRS